MAVGGDETLFCQVAIAHGFVSEEVIDRCRVRQAESGKPLVIHLIEQGHVDDKTLEAVIELVEKQVRGRERERRAVPGLFGEIAVERGFLSQEQVDEAVRRQRREKARGCVLRIGQILVEKGHLSHPQVSEILSVQNKRVVRCSGCRSKFNIRQFESGRVYHCRKCGYPLDTDEPMGSEGAVSSQIVGQTLVGVEETGSTLIGREVSGYEIAEMIGEGGMAEVYKVVSPDGDARALKIMKSTAEIERFRREIRSVRKIDHPNVIRVFDDGTLDGKPYFFMEIIEGETLVERVDRFEVSVVEGLEILRQVASGLGAAHAEGVIHRDVKPSNILLGRDRQGGIEVKITDFGVARSWADTQVTAEGELLGTFKYMSPEHIRGIPLDGRSDLFGLGVIAYEILAGREPFSGRPAERTATGRAARSLRGGDRLSTGPPPGTDSRRPRHWDRDRSGKTLHRGPAAGRAPSGRTLSAGDAPRGDLPRPHPRRDRRRPARHAPDHRGPPRRSGRAGALASGVVKRFTASRTRVARRSSRRASSPAPVRCGSA